CTGARWISSLRDFWRCAVPPDSLLRPIAAMTDHRLLSHEEEAALIATMRRGAAAREVLSHQQLPGDPALLCEVSAGEAARTTLARHNLRLVVAIAKRYERVAGEHLTLED